MMKKWLLFLSLAAVFCLSAAAMPFFAGFAAEEGDAYTIDFSQSGVQESLVPYYVNIATDGYAEELSAHFFGRSARTELLFQRREFKSCQISAKNSDLSRIIH